MAPSALLAGSSCGVIWRCPLWPGCLLDAGLIIVPISRPCRFSFVTSDVRKYVKIIIMAERAAVLCRRFFTSRPWISARPHIFREKVGNEQLRWHWPGSSDIVPTRIFYDPHKNPWSLGRDRFRTVQVWDFHTRTYPRTFIVHLLSAFLRGFFSTTHGCKIKANRFYIASSMMMGNLVSPIN